MVSNITRRGVVAGAAMLAASRPRAEGLEKLTIGALPYTSSGHVHLALAKGWFREEGVEVTLKSFNTAGPATIAVVSGDIDLGVTGLTAAFYNMAEKGTIRMIRGQSREQPGFQGNGFVVSNKAWDEGVRSIPALAGRRVGNTVLGSTIHYSILLAANKYGMDPAGFEMVQLQSLPNMAAAFRGGSVDAIVATSGQYQDLQAQGFGKLIAWVGDITPWQLGALFATPKTLRERRATVEKFVRGYVRGAAAYNATFNQRDAQGNIIKPPNYDAYLTILAEAIGQPRAQVEIALAYVPPDAFLDVDDIARQVANWQAAGLVDPKLKSADVIDTSFM